MESETKVIEQPHSCKISINQKGKWSGEVKVYAETALLAREVAVIHATSLATKIKEINDE